MLRVVRYSKGISSRRDRAARYCSAKEVCPVQARDDRVELCDAIVDDDPGEVS